MLNKKVFIALVVVVALALGIPAMVSAQAADDQAWSSYITYYTPSTTGGNLQISYYEEGSSTAINANPISLSAHASGELFIGSTTAIPGMPASFSGSAVLSSDVPVVATYVQVASGAESAYPRPLYTGFNPSDAATTFYIPSFLANKFNINSSVGIQNVEAFQITADVKLYSVGSSTASYSKNVTIEPQSTVLLRATDFGMSAGAVFNGSMKIENATGKVVASVIEYQTNALDAKAFEGIATAAPKVYMPSMMCRYQSMRQITYYAIQNAGTVSTDVNVYYYDRDGVLLDTVQHTIGVASKVSINPCKDGIADNTIGSAVIESQNSQDLLVVGKVNSDIQTATGFMGQSEGATTVAASYIRWSGNEVDYGGWRSFIAVMNVGSAPATNVVANYYKADGTLAASHDLDVAAGGSLGVNIKVNTTPKKAGAVDSNNDFGADGGGSVEIVSDQPVIVVVRVAKNFAEGTYGTGITKFAEDYNGVAVD